MALSNRRWGLGWFACVAIGCLYLGQQALAHDNEKMCGGVKDGDGEPVLQSDGDVVLHAGSSPCPEEPPSASDPTVGTIYFDFDMAEPNADGQAALAALINALSAGKPSSVSVEGHADRAGSDAYNLGLSRQRADNVANALIGSGVPEGVVVREALGESDPAVPTADGVRNAANRRAEVKIEF